MSRLASRVPGASKRLAPDEDELCNVCKSSRYLNPDMRFLVNPECYHKMCESCVDRIFTHGPAPCPLAGCNKTLRKARFRTQTFEDLKVEREVDIRRRIAKAMNKQESDFERLIDYNNYLEIVEEVTWNLILNIDVEETERKLRLWEEAQKAELNPNATFRRVTDQPEASQLSDSSHVVLKKGGTQRRALATSSGNTSTPSGTEESGKRDTGFVFQGLKKRKLPPPEKAFDPFDGWSIEPQYYALQENHNYQWLTTYDSDPAYFAGGWQTRDYYSRMMEEAFGGMCIFLEDEKVAPLGSGDDDVGTQNAANAAIGMKDVVMDDVF
ncbi:unnamed protein product [Periconia digitata]|uniref:RNA polymerase II transcription factor B subunit 3 n=1 Tax=Periconia digitata TaxID=1303443 RepID=A0A9W4UAS2_9PLEO|nr:unnamed protein product [Periconia digitata]